MAKRIIAILIMTALYFIMVSYFIYQGAIQGDLTQKRLQACEQLGNKSLEGN